MSGPNGRGGSGEQRIIIDPRGSFRARQRRLLDDDPLSAPPPSLLPSEDEDSDRRPMPYRWSPSTPLAPIGYPDEDLDPEREALRLRVRPGHRPDRLASVRVYHRLDDAPQAGLEGRCWAFTITRAAYDRLVTERVLDSEGATNPTGEPVVPPGLDPLYVAVRCGSCGTQSVTCLQMEFWQD